jgi:hypothetical protein
MAKYQTTKDAASRAYRAWQTAQAAAKAVESVEATAMREWLDANEKLKQLEQRSADEALARNVRESKTMVCAYEVGTIEVPEGSVVLGVISHAYANPTPQILVRVNCESRMDSRVPLVERQFILAGTNDYAPPMDTGRYIGSCIASSNGNIVHLFEIITGAHD